MNDVLPVPAHRELPDDVRERMRDRVMRGRRDRSSRRGPLLVAAAVVLLAAGGVVVARSVGGEHPPAAGWTPVPADSVTTEATTDEDLARCGVDWRPDYTVVMRGRRIVVSPVNEFCELTYASVRTSAKKDPVVVGDGVVLWQTPGHLTIGKAPAGSTSVKFSDTEGTVVAGALDAVVALLPDGRFVVRSGREVDALEFGSGGWAPRTMKVVKGDLPGDWSVVRWVFPSGVGIRGCRGTGWPRAWIGGWWTCRSLRIPRGGGLSWEWRGRSGCR